MPSTETTDPVWLEEARTRAASEDAKGYVASGIALWKRAHFKAYLGGKSMRFASVSAARDIALRTGARHMHWATKPFSGPDDGLLRIEDGFLRSHGLGLRLLPPLSIVIDDLGIHYDPSRESRLERLIATPLPDGGATRAADLIARITGARLTKYNTGQALLSADLKPGHRILVAGQVEDDASVLKGATGAIRSNISLLQAARAANPNAVILWKPHPDVEAGFRKGRIAPEVAAKFADHILDDTHASDAVALADEVWTMTSLIGFEALLRSKHVTVAGLPFYAGWGLTTDLTAPPARRTARPDLHTLAHAALIAYPRYWHPLTAAPISPEMAVTCLEQGLSAKRGTVASLLARGRRRA
jgi:capsular polysaccharide export protein